MATEPSTTDWSEKVEVEEDGCYSFGSSPCNVSFVFSEGIVKANSAYIRRKCNYFASLHFNSSPDSENFAIPIGSHAFHAFCELIRIFYELTQCPDDLSHASLDCVFQLSGLVDYYQLNDDVKQLLKDTVLHRYKSMRIFDVVDAWDTAVKCRAAPYIVSCTAEHLFSSSRLNILHHYRFIPDFSNEQMKIVFSLPSTLIRNSADWIALDWMSSRGPEELPFLRSLGVQPGVHQPLRWSMNMRLHYLNLLWAYGLDRTSVLDSIRRYTHPVCAAHVLHYVEEWRAIGAKGFDGLYDFCLAKISNNVDIVILSMGYLALSKEVIVDLQNKNKRQTAHLAYLWAIAKGEEPVEEEKTDIRARTLTRMESSRAIRVLRLFLKIAFERHDIVMVQTIAENLARVDKMSAVNFLDIMMIALEFDLHQVAHIVSTFVDDNYTDKAVHKNICMLKEADREHILTMLSENFRNYYYEAEEKLKETLKKKARISI